MEEIVNAAQWLDIYKAMIMGLLFLSLERTVNDDKFEKKKNI